MADINRFDTEKQVMGICVLFSFWRVLSYFKHEENEQDFSIEEFCRKYVLFIGTNYTLFTNTDFIQTLIADLHHSRFGNRELCSELLQLIDNETLSAEAALDMDRSSLEFLTASVFHYYCQHIENDIRGYQHIEWLWEKIIEGRFLSKYRYDDIHIENIQVNDNIADRIRGHLNNSIDAFVMVFTVEENGRGHSRVVCKYNDIIYVGDPNDDRFKRLEMHNDLCENRDYCSLFKNGNSRISECILIAPNE